MNWKQWANWKEKKYIAVIGFIIAYLVTIPIRNYEFLENFINITNGVPILAHLIIILFGSLIVIVLLKIIENVVER